MLKIKYLKDDALYALKNYKYVSGTYTPIDVAMQGFWEGCTKMLPMTMAPNMVTLIGTGFAMMSVVMYIPYDLTFSKEFPPIFYFLSAASIFIYQTFDAIDGK